MTTLLEKRVTEVLLEVLVPLWEHALQCTEEALRRGVHRGEEPGRTAARPTLRVRVSRLPLGMAAASLAQALLHGGALLEVCETVAATALHSDAGASKSVVAQLVDGLMSVAVDGGLPCARLVSCLGALQASLTPPSGTPARLCGEATTHEGLDTVCDVDDEAEDANGERLLDEDTLVELAAALVVVLRGAVLEACEALTSALAPDGSALDAEESCAARRAQSGPACPPISGAHHTRPSGSAALHSFAHVAESLADAQRGRTAATLKRASSPPIPPSPASLLTGPRGGAGKGLDAAVLVHPAHSPSAPGTGGGGAQTPWWALYATLACDGVDGEEADQSPGRQRTCGMAARVHFSPADPQHLTLVLPLPGADRYASMPLPGRVEAPQDSATPALATIRRADKDDKDDAKQLEEADLEDATRSARRLFSQVARGAVQRAQRLATSTAPTTTSTASSSRAHADSARLLWPTSALRYRTAQSAAVHRQYAVLARHEPQAALFPADEEEEIPPRRGPGLGSDEEEEKALEWFAPHHHPYLGINTLAERDAETWHDTRAVRHKRQRDDRGDAMAVRRADDGADTSAPSPSSPTHPRTSWLRLHASTATPLSDGCAEDDLVESLAPLVHVPDALAGSDDRAACLAALEEVGTVLEAVDDVFAGRTVLDASSWRYGRNRLPVVALSEVFATLPASTDEVESDDVHMERLAFYLHEAGILHTNTGAMAALDVSEMDDV